MNFINVLLWIWQFPQHILGKLMSTKYIIKDFRIYDSEKIVVYFCRNVFGCGVSLGNYILLDISYSYMSEEYLELTLRHENGHSKQSKIFGPLYLLVIGFTSMICNNVWDRLFHKKWSSDKRSKWYYTRFPEKWADTLGGAVRFTKD